MTTIQASDNVVRGLIEDGVELEYVQKVLGVWLEKHNVIFMHDYVGREWLIQHADGCIMEPYRFHSFHEMLEHVLTLIDSQVPA